MIYLDNSATTRPFDEVIDAMAACMRERYFNASAAYRPAMEAEKEVDACRRALAAELGAQPGGVIFTSGGTEADNLAILGTAMTLRGESNFAISAIEHPAVAETVRRVERLGFEVRVLPIDARGIVDLAACEGIIDGHTALVSCMQVSNETGAVQPVAALSALARKKNPNVRVHVDGVQGFMRVPVHMGRDGVDMYSLSGHKIHGPKGIGALVVRGNLRLAAQMTGGGQEKGLRSGTTDSPAIVALHEAVRQMAARRQEIDRLREMKARLWQQVSSVEGARVNGPLPGEADSAPHILSLSFAGVRGEVLRNALEGEGVLVSTGSACASHKQKVSASLRAMGLTAEQADGTIRVSLGLYNTMDEMDETAGKLARICGVLSQYRRR
ncbi:MAG: cysteine desulfurase [Clostridiales bacterium]|nr:cysteine desulfurase [Clostridiales bacterium]